MKLTTTLSPLHALAAGLAAATVALAAVTLNSNLAGAAPIIHRCGAPINSIVKTNSFAVFATQSTIYENVTDAVVNVTVPAGATRCVKVRFSGIVNCTETAAIDGCYIVVAAPPFAFDPATNTIAYQQENNNYSAQSFEFAKRLNPGVYKIAVTARVFDAATTFNIFSWTMDVEIAK